MSHDLKKTAIRQRMLEKLRAFQPDLREEMSAGVRVILSTFQPLHKATTILAFAPLPSEPQIDHLLDAWRAEGRRILLPRTLERAGAMEMVELTGLMSKLPSGPLGIRTPIGPACEACSIDAILVPGVAFDHNGGRLGRGGGYYDRLLATQEATMTIGTAFECQLNPRLPQEEHDQEVRFIATEKRAFECPPRSEGSLSE
jgi:5-formyltetrahydrofolate cyclo-ligase